MSNITESAKDKFDKVYQELKTERDVLKVRAHLAKAELKDKWQQTEEKWQHFTSKAKVIGKGVGEASADTGDGFEALGKELKKAYLDIKKGFKSSGLTK